MHAPLKAALQMHAPIHRFGARSCAAGPEIGGIAAQHLQGMAALLQSPGKVRHAASVAAQFLGWVEVGDQQQPHRARFGPIS